MKKLIKVKITSKHLSQTQKLKPKELSTVTSQSVSSGEDEDESFFVIKKDSFINDSQVKFSTNK